MRVALLLLLLLTCAHRNADADSAPAGRLVHAVGQHTADTVRLAIFGDFQQERPVLGKEEHEQLGQYEWWHTAVGLFEEDRLSSDGVWAGWAIE